MIYSIYFSPTGTSKRNANSIAKVFDDNFTQIALENPKYESTVSLTKNDIVVFSAPVYGGLIYNGAIDKIKEIKGNGAIAIAAATYGNRDFDDALIELYDVLTENGFIVVAGAALVGEHSFGKVATGRPCADDLAQNIDFAHKVSEKIQSGNLTLENVPGNRPYINGGNGGKFFTTTDEKCIKCGKCQRDCPMGAICSTDYSKLDESLCIACQRCVKNCPVGSRHVYTEGYEQFAVDFTAKLAKPCVNKYFI